MKTKLNEKLQMKEDYQQKVHVWNVQWSFETVSSTQKK
jgi:hypothetical protein